MEQLPSYGEATGRKDWLDVVAPYVDVRDYPNLCRVSTRFYLHFAPRLWKDPVCTIRALRLRPENGRPPFPSHDSYICAVADAA